MAKFFSKEKIIAAKDKLTGVEKDSAADLDPEKLKKYQDIATRMFHTPQLPAREMAMPPLARVGRQISDQINGVYRRFYFVSILRIDMLYVVLIEALIGIYDVLNNPLMGIVYDRTRTRWGKARPYALLFPMFYYVATALLFCGQLFFDNDNTADPGKILYVFIIMFAQETFVTLYRIPMDNFNTLITPNPDDRMSMGMWTTYARRWSGDFLSGMMMPLLDMARHGIFGLKPGTIFAFFGLLSAFTGTTGAMMMAVNCRERLMLQPEPAPPQKTILYILKNKYALREFIANFLTGWWSDGGYSWDVVSQLEIFGGAIRTMPFYIPRNVLQIGSIVLVEPFKKLFGGRYRKTIILMRSWDFVSSVSASLISLLTNVANTWWQAGLVFAIFDGLNCANDSPSDVLEREIDNEIRDYTEFVTGERPDGTIGLITDLMGQVTRPINALMTIAMFRWSGYDPNIAANRPWSQAMVRENSTMYRRVLFLYNLTNIPRFLARLVPMLMYDLEGEKKEKMYVVLNERRAMLAKERLVSKEMMAIMEMLSETDEAKGEAKV